MTNGDRLRSMTDEQLAEFLKGIDIGEIVPEFCEKLCMVKLDAPCRQKGPGWCIWRERRQDDLGAWAWWLGQEEDG